VNALPAPSTGLFYYYGANMNISAGYAVTQVTIYDVPTVVNCTALSPGFACAGDPLGSIFTSFTTATDPGTFVPNAGTSIAAGYYLPDNGALVGPSSLSVYSYTPQLCSPCMVCPGGVDASGNNISTTSPKTLTLPGSTPPGTIASGTGLGITAIKYGCYVSSAATTTTGLVTVTNASSLAITAVGNFPTSASGVPLALPTPTPATPLTYPSAATPFTGATLLPGFYLTSVNTTANCSLTAPGAVCAGGLITTFNPFSSGDLTSAGISAILPGFYLSRFTNITSFTITSCTGVLGITCAGATLTPTPALYGGLSVNKGFFIPAVSVTPVNVTLTAAAGVLTDGFAAGAILSGPIVPAACPANATCAGVSSSSMFYINSGITVPSGFYTVSYDPVAGPTLAACPTGAFCVGDQYGSSVWLNAGVPTQTTIKSIWDAASVGTIGLIPGTGVFVAANYYLATPYNTSYGGVPDIRACPTGATCTGSSSSVVSNFVPLVTRPVTYVSGSTSVQLCPPVLVDDDLAGTCNAKPSPAYYGVSINPGYYVAQYNVQSLAPYSLASPNAFVSIPNAILPCPNYALCNGDLSPLDPAYFGVTLLPNYWVTSFLAGGVPSIYPIPIGVTCPADLTIATVFKVGSSCFNSNNYYIPSNGVVLPCAANSTCTSGLLPGYLVYGNPGTTVTYPLGITPVSTSFYATSLNPWTVAPVNATMMTGCGTPVLSNRLYSDCTVASSAYYVTYNGTILPCPTGATCTGTQALKTPGGISAVLTGYMVTAVSTMSSGLNNILAIAPCPAGAQCTAVTGAAATSTLPFANALLTSNGYYVSAPGVTSLCPQGATCNGVDTNGVRPGLPLTAAGGAFVKPGYYTPFPNSMPYVCLPGTACPGGGAVGVMGGALRCAERMSAPL
jgi:hypothetical protein